VETLPMQAAAMMAEACWTWSVVPDTAYELAKEQMEVEISEVVP
jgi:hypothetical protein